LRADPGHYVLLPPSLHPDGPAYVWLNPLPDGALPPLPPSLAVPPGQGQAKADPETQRRKYTKPLAPSLCPRNREDVRQAVARTLPTGPRQRRRLLFDLARALKALLPEATPAELRGILQDWHRQALPFIRTKPFSTSWTDFVEGWQSVK